MADHRKIRRLREVLDDAARHGAASSSDWILAHIWDRLAELLEGHTWAEEEICYLPMSGSSLHPEERRRDAVADHEDIREAIVETKLQPIGSALWWRSARAVLAVSVSHLDREENDMLAGWLPGLTMARRLELGHQWLAFIAARRLEDAEASGTNVRVRRPAAVADATGLAGAGPGSHARAERPVSGGQG